MALSLSYFVHTYTWYILLDFTNIAFMLTYFLQAYLYNVFFYVRLEFIFIFLFKIFLFKIYVMRERYITTICVKNYNEANVSR